MNLRTLTKYEQAPDQMRSGVLAVAGFNCLGFLILVLTETNPAIPSWPPLASAVVGFLIGLTLILKAKSVSSRRATWLFVINTVAVTVALSLENIYYARHVDHWVPFRPAQLACLFVALVAPSFRLGVFAILAHAGTSIVQLATFTPQMTSHLQKGEPGPTLGFALAGALLLVFRYRNLASQREYHRARVSAASAKILANNYSMIRDRMNTPLQTLETSFTLLADSNCGSGEILARCQRAVKQLNHLNGLLRGMRK